MPTVSNEEKRKRIKNLRRRVYDSLNVLLACEIFFKNRKKVVLNPQFLKSLPDSLKAYADMDSDNEVSLDNDGSSLEIKKEPVNGENTLNDQASVLGCKSSSQKNNPNEDTLARITTGTLAHQKGEI